MNLVLIGYRGTGKSTIGKQIARTLQMDYVGFDQEIVNRAGMSIPEIVEKYSWDYFRDLESQVVEDFSCQDNQVLDTGGGVITRARNTENLKKNGVVFLLAATVEDIIKRIAATQDRPSLTGEHSFLEEIDGVLKERQPLYQAAADYVINTSQLSPGQAAEKIIKLFQDRIH
jgi:shikimate kinase